MVKEQIKPNVAIFYLVTQSDLGNDRTKEVNELRRLPKVTCVETSSKKGEVIGAIKLFKLLFSHKLTKKTSILFQLFLILLWNYKNKQNPKFKNVADVCDNQYYIIELCMIIKKKVVFVGKPKVGKTTLLKNGEKDTEKSGTTFGVEFYTKEVK